MQTPALPPPVWPPGWPDFVADDTGRVASCSDMACARVAPGTVLWSAPTLPPVNRHVATSLYRERMGSR